MSTQVTKVWWDGDKLITEAIPEADLYAQPAQKPFGYLSISDTPIFQKETPEIGRWETLYAAPPKPEQESGPDELTVVYMSGVFEGRKLEREACAEVVDKRLKTWASLVGKDKAYKWLEKIAVTIRARGNT